MSPARRAASQEAESEEEAPTAEKSATIADVERIVSEAIESVKNAFRSEPAEGASEATETATSEAEEEVESPRAQEARVRRAVENAVGQLHIHVGEPEKKAKPEPEAAPGKPSFLQKLIGLS